MFDSDTYRHRAGNTSFLLAGITVQEAQIWNSTEKMRHPYLCISDHLNIFFLEEYLIHNKCQGKKSLEISHICL